MTSIAEQLNSPNDGELTITASVRRDRWGRPVILRPDGTEKAYTRCTTFVKALDDTFNLEKWGKRRVARGLALRSDLLLAAQSIPDEYDEELSEADKRQAKRDMDRLCEDAVKAAASDRAANVGTAIHKFAERIDLGQTVRVPASVAADVDAYRRVTEPFRALHIETLMVLDEYEVAGTPDRVLVIDDEPYIGDLKTGQSLDFGIGTIAMQMAVYSRSSLYDPGTGARKPLVVNQDRALIIHLPAGSGKAELVWVNIAAGWEAVRLAAEVRAWRGRKDLATPYVDALLALIGDATDAEALSALWRAYRDCWTETHTVAAKARKTELEA